MAVAVCFMLLLSGLIADPPSPPSARSKPFSPHRLASAMQPETHRHRRRVHTLLS